MIKYRFYIDGKDDGCTTFEKVPRRGDTVIRQTWGANYDQPDIITRTEVTGVDRENRRVYTKKK